MPNIKGMIKSAGVFPGWWIVIASGVIWATAIGSYQTFGVFLKPIQNEFGWGRAVTASAFLISGLTAAILAPVTGTLSDRFGPRLVVTCSGIVSTTGYFLVSLVHTQWQLYGVFVLMGTVMTFSVPIQATISRWFTLRRGLALGLAGIGGGLGQALWPPLAQFLIDHFGWRQAYLILGAILGVIMVSAAQVIKGRPEAKGLLPYGEKEGAAGQALNINKKPALTLSQAVRTRTFWMILAAIACASLTLQMILVHLVPYTTDPEIGLSSIVAASLLSTIGWTNVLGKVAMGAISDRIGPRATLAICYGIAGAAMLWLLAAKELWMLYLFAAVLGFCYGGWIPVRSAVIGSLFGLSSMGAVLGVIETGANTAGATGSMLGGYIYDVTNSYHQAFILGAILFFSATILVILLGKPKVPNQQVSPLMKNH
ncbi:MAG: MFS transporter [Dehalococcoidia bacterium]|nr:MFS transporter [Dehalococcoidia bacterium]